MANPNCPDCKGTGRITLLTSTVLCECKDTTKLFEIEPNLIAPKSFAKSSVLRNAWYSLMNDKTQGHCLYKLVGGEQVKITEVSFKSEPCRTWPDLKYVGVVERWISGSRH